MCCAYDCVDSVMELRLFEPVLASGHSTAWMQHGRTRKQVYLPMSQYFDDLEPSSTDLHGVIWRFPLWPWPVFFLFFLTLLELPKTSTCKIWCAASFTAISRISRLHFNPVFPPYLALQAQRSSVSRHARRPPTCPPNPFTSTSPLFMCHALDKMLLGRLVGGLQGMTSARSVCCAATEV